MPFERQEQQGAWRIEEVEVAAKILPGDAEDRVWACVRSRRRASSLISRRAAGEGSRSIGSAAMLLT
jgi:hypothetical protein